MMSLCMKRLSGIIMSLFLIFNVLPFSTVHETNAYDQLIRGIDISEFQTVTDWNSVAKSVDFVIIRVGTTTGLNNDNFRKDKKFESHFEGAKNAGFPIGIYYYSGANTLSGFQKNATECVEYLNGKNVDYPVYLDVEQSTGQMSLGKSTLTSYILSALKIISNAGYKAGVYANQDWFNNYVDGSAIRNAGYSTWLARYPSAKYAVEPSGYDYSSNYDIWQYSSVGKVSGISGDVDVDVSYVDFRTSDFKDDPIAPYPRPTGNPLIQKGAKGDYVRWIQYTLGVQLGYSIGSAGVDGDFGSATDSAVIEFQRDNGLEVDGQVGPITITKIVEKVLEKLNHPDMEVPIISTDAATYTVGDTVHISWKASPDNSDLEHYWLIIEAPSGIILNETMDRRTEYSFVVSEQGSYTITSFATPLNSPNGEGSLSDSRTITVESQIIEKPHTSILEADKDSAYIGEPILFNATSDIATGYTIGIDKEGTRVVTENMPNGALSLTFDEPGEYSAYVTSYNEVGYTDSDRITFKVYDKPQDISFTSDKNNIIVGETITFSAYSDSATGYILEIIKDNTAIIQQEMTDGILSLVFDEAGEYDAYVTFYNRIGETNSKKIVFNVVCEISIPLNEDYRIPINSEQVTYKSHNNSIVTVSSDGLLTGLSKGSTIVSIIDEDSNVYQITVHVMDITETTPETTMQSIIYGDVNLDGKINVSDAVAVLQYVANQSKYALNEQARINADVDGSIGITGSDAIIIQKVDASVISQSDLPIHL